MILFQAQSYKRASGFSFTKAGRTAKLWMIF